MDALNSPDRLERVEAKLDLLIAMMLDDEEQPDHTALEDDSDVMDNQYPQSL